MAQVYLRDLAAGSTVRVSVDSNGVLADGDSQPAALSSDGTRVAFASVATNLVAGDTNGASDVFLRDLATGQTVRVSVATGGGQSNGDSLAPSISASGDKIAFESSATNLVGNDTNGSWDIFWRDLGTGLTRRASIDSSSAQSNGSSHDPAISGDSRQVAFDSEATNLVAGDGNGRLDVFVRAAAAPPVAFCFGDGTEAIGCPCSNVGAAGRGCENSAATGGALLGAEGTTQPDTLVLNVTGELPHALSLFLESREVTDAALFLGDGLRCLGGPPKRLYAHRATAGSVSAPADGELAISARSAELGDVIAPGTTRFYQVYYRDPAPGFCPAPLGNTINTSNALRVYW